MKYEYDQKIDNIQKKYESIIEKMETKFENIINKLTDNINRMQKDYGNEFNNTRNDYIEKIDKLKNDCNDKIKKESKKTDEQFINVNKNINKTIEEMKQQYKRKFEQIDTNYESKNKEIDKNTEEITKKINKVQINYEKQNNEMNKKFQTDLFSHFVILSMMDKEDPKIDSLINIIKFLSKANLHTKDPINIFESIFIPNESTNLQAILKRERIDIKNIGIHSNLLDMIFADPSLDLSDLISNLQCFSSITFELKMSSKFFNEILERISKIKKTTIEIVFDCQYNKHISLSCRKYIQQIRFDPSITKINDDIKNYSTLKKIIIPTTIIEINDKAFNKCETNYGSFIFGIK